ncbi:MAG TPA: aldo/keto reductase [Mycobacteriales bacterium]|nr:aldo/keto reductase [Mycobacteriales bacterium]
MGHVPTIELNSGQSIPQLGFGVFQVPPPETARIVTAALEAGYRSIDTAAAYRNEEGVGAAIASSGIPREELYITTKLANPAQGYDSTLREFDVSMQKLGLDYLDLYLIHWPIPAKDEYVATWQAFEKLHADGRIRSIGVSNFQPAHLDRLAQECNVVPALNQIELHPFLQQEELRAYHAEHGIATEAWSPLAQGGEFLQNSTLTGLADKYGKSPAQIVLRWHIQLGNVVIPKSATPSRIVENFQLFDFELAADDMAGIAALDEGHRTGPDPDVFGA